MTTRLYPAQQTLVDAVLARPGRPLRTLIAAETGTGKSGMALTLATRLVPQRMLIVCPAIVRVHWRDEIAKWAPGWEGNAGIIEFGRDRKMPSKPAEARRAHSYAQSIQIVSYDLVGEVEARLWDVIIVDECHALGAPLSKQSKNIAALVDANPSANVIMLSATPVPTVMKQLWHPLYLLEGDKWGKPSATGDVSWTFARRYCGIVSTEHGKAIGNGTPGGLERLGDDLRGVMHRLTAKEVAPDMPPLRVSPLYAKKLDVTFFKDWIKSLESDVTHAVIFTHLKATARTVETIAHATGWPVTYLDGEVPAGTRANRLKEIAALPRHILVATYDSLSVGVRLLWPQRALICEFSASPKTTAQVLGRFAAVGDARRPAVHCVVRPGDEQLAGTLLNRVGTIAAAIGSGGQDEALSATFGEDLSNKFGSIFDDMNDYEAPAGWGDDEDE